MKCQWMTGLVVLMAIWVAGCGAAPASVAAPDEAPETAEQAAPATGAAPLPTAPPPAQTAAAGPWLVFLAPAADDDAYERYLWAAEENGEGLIQLIPERTLTFAAQPPGTSSDETLIAYITQASFESNDVTLKLISYPSQAITTITPLVGDFPSDEAPNALYNLITAVEEGGLAWSPDGRLLAFVGAMDGVSVDVYLYDTLDGSIARLTDGPSQAFGLQWSPDGRYVVHKGFVFVGMGGAEPSAMWAAQVNGERTVTLTAIAEDDFGGYYELIGWRSPSEAILRNESYLANVSEIRAVNLDTGGVRILQEGSYRDIAYAPEHDAVLLVSWSSETEEPPLILSGAGERQEIPVGPIASVSWWPLYDSFFGLADNGMLYKISPDGQVEQLPSPAWKGMQAPGILPSPDNKTWAWFNYEFYSSYSELWIGEAMATPSQLQASDPVQPGLWVRDISWAPDSRRLLALTNAGLWRADAPDFTLVKVDERVSSNPWYLWQAQWIP